MEEKKMDFVEKYYLGLGKQTEYSESYFSYMVVFLYENIHVCCGH